MSETADETGSNPKRYLEYETRGIQKGEKLDFILFSFYFYYVGGDYE